NSCTDDSCDKTKGCVAKQNTATCDDGNKCTDKDLCKGGTCASGAVKTCDDGDACTADSCEPVSGKCQHKAISNCKSCTKALDCNDNNACTTETCEGGKCKGSQLKDGAACDDGSFCTKGDACFAGTCKPGKTQTCDDNNPCTFDLCDASAKKCTNGPVAKGFQCGTTKILDDFKCVGSAVYKRPGFAGCTGSASAPKCSTDPANLFYKDYVKVSDCKSPNICRIESGKGFCGLPKKPDLEITGFKLDKAQYKAGESVKVTWTVQNKGIVASPVVRLNFYVSVDATITGKDLYKGGINLPAIAPGKTATGAYSVILRSNLGKSTRYVGAIVDALNKAAEINEKNNTKAVKITTVPAGDIWVSTSSKPQYTTINWGQKLGYYRYTRNIGTVKVGKHTDKLWLSADGKVDKSDINLLTLAKPEMAPNKYIYGWVFFTMPKTVKPGTWYIIYQADSGNAVQEGNEGNNYRVTKVTYRGYYDLVPTVLKAPASIPTGTPFTVELAGKNNGNATTGTFYDRVYFSKDTKVGSDVYLATMTRKAIKGGQAWSNKLNLNVPSSVTGGVWYLMYRVDSHSRVKETNEANNFKFLKVNIVPMPNLRTYAYKTYSSAYYVNSTMTWYSYDRNYGTATAGQYELQYYLSTDDKWDSKDTLLAKFTRGPLKPGQAQSTTGKWKIPGNYKPGKYWLIIRTDATNKIKESNENDNQVKYAFTIKGRADLTGSIKTATTTITAGTKSAVTLTWNNIGQATAALHYDRVYLNTKKAYGGTYLGQRTRQALAAGKSGSAVFSFTPSAFLKPGTYYIVYRVDSHSKVPESNESNNLSFLQVTVKGLPDLYPYYLKVNTTKPFSGQQLSVSWAVRNYRFGTSSKTTVRFLLSKDTKVSKDDIKVGESDVASLAYGKIALGNLKVTIPKTITGAWRLLMVVDPDNKVKEVYETNNVRNVALSIIGAPDIAVTALTVSPTAAKAGTQIKVTATHKNLGNVAKGFTATLHLVLSATSSLKLMEKLQPTLDPNKEATAVESVVIPGTVKPGTYKLRWSVVVAGEANKANNVKEAAFTVK
ncbi:MAG: hypothetical protein KC502_17080, partial [Myxococcales bacterium]|nr:hypothetical protein [Myxococcales bacterium]